jgi:hypothetical protein
MCEYSVKKILVYMAGRSGYSLVQKIGEQTLCFQEEAGFDPRGLSHYVQDKACEEKADGKTLPAYPELVALYKRRLLPCDDSYLDPCKNGEEILETKGQIRTVIARFEKMSSGIIDVGQVGDILENELVPRVWKLIATVEQNIPGDALRDEAMASLVALAEGFRQMKVGGEFTGRDSLSVDWLFDVWERYCGLVPGAGMISDPFLLI